MDRTLAPARSVATVLTRWYALCARDLPWRRTRDPYRILVSEFLLAQTRVATVVPRYRRFLARFPTIEKVASATEEEVIREWEGLGYYARARNLRRAAREIAAAGTFPRTRKELEALPGVGPYTAGAVASIAFDLPEPALDSNATRVLARLDGVTRSVAEPEVRRRLSRRLGSVLREGSPRTLSQAVMELGALVCTPRAPRCGECPLFPACRSRRSGSVHRIPARKRARAPREIRIAFARVRRGSRVLLVRRPATGLLAGQWCFPGVGVPGAAAARPKLHQALLAIGIDAQVGVRVASGVHRFTHLRWRYEVYDAKARTVPSVGRFVTARAARNLTVITAHRPYVATRRFNTRGARTR